MTHTYTQNHNNKTTIQMSCITNWQHLSKDTGTEEEKKRKTNVFANKMDSSTRVIISAGAVTRAFPWEPRVLH